MRVLALVLLSSLVGCGTTSGRDAGSGGGAGGGVFFATSGGTGGGSAGGRAGGAGGGAAGGASTGGGSVTGGGASMGGGMATGGGTAAHDGGSEGVNCGGEVCAGSTPVCCATQTGGMLGLSCEAGCADGGADFSCDGPSDCDGDAGTPFCCANLDLGAGMFPACPAQSLSARCSATCATTVGLVCPTRGTARLCQSAASDCTAAQKCCAFAQGSATIQVCVSSALPCQNIP